MTRHLNMEGLQNHPKPVLPNIPLFQNLTPSELSEMESIIVTRRYVKQQIILREEDTPFFMYIVFSGRVKVVSIGGDGTEHILAFHKKGGYFGEMALLDQKTSPATVIALEDSRIGLISKNDFQKTLLNNDKMYPHVIEMLCTRLREAWLMLKVLRYTSSEQRVRGVLANFASLYGISEQRGTIICIKLTHDNIAAYAAVSRETVTRLLKRLYEANEIAFLDNKQIIITPSFQKNT